MSETKMEMKIVLDYIDEGIALDLDSVEDAMNKLEYIRNYFIVYFYDRNLEILKTISKIIDLYYMENEHHPKTQYIKLREIFMNWAKYEKTIS